MTESSYESLVRPHIDRLYRLAYRLTGTRDDAEDLVQDVLVTAYGRRSELSSIDGLGAWLARILYNRFVDNRRRYERRRLTLVPAAAAGPAGDPELAATAERPVDEAVALQFDIKALQAAVAELSLEHRTVLLMHDAEGYKLEEIHRITAIEIGTLKSRLHRARARLREILATHGTF